MVCYGWGKGVLPLLGAIVGCHCCVLCLGGSDDQVWGIGRAAVVGCLVGCLTTNFGGADVLPLLGASVGCHCGVLCLGGRVMILREWTCCHCWVPLWRAMFG